MPNAKRPLRFGLKSFLVCLTLPGGGVGFAGRLWRTNPELVLYAIQWGPLVASLFCLAMAIRSSSSRRGPFFLLAAAATLTLPMLGLQSDQQKLHWLPTRYILHSRLTKAPDDRKAWKEIEHRIYLNIIRRDVVEEYVSDLLRQHNESDGRPTQSVWPYMGSQTLMLAAQRGLLSEHKLIELANARFGKPDVHTLRIREGQTQFPLNIQFHAASSGVMLCPLALFWDPGDTWIDEQPVKVNTGQLKNHTINLPTGLPLGEHELRVNLQCGYSTRSRLSNAEALPHNAWPKTVHEWTERVVIPLKVFKTDATIVSTIVDPDLNPTELLQFDRLTSLKVFDGGAWKNTLGARVRVKTPHRLPCAMSFDMFLLVEGNRLPAGHFFAYRNKTESDFQHKSSDLGDFRLPPIGRADLEFVPNTAHVELQTNVLQIWGKRFVLRNIPIPEFHQP